MKVPVANDDDDDNLFKQFSELSGLDLMCECCYYCQQRHTQCNYDYDPDNGTTKHYVLLSLCRRRVEEEISFLCVGDKYRRAADSNNFFLFNNYYNDSFFLVLLTV